MSAAGRDVGELPIEAGDAVGDQDTIAGEGAEGDGDLLAREAEFESRCSV